MSSDKSSCWSHRPADVSRGGFAAG